ncbi:MAG: hypothetical protein JWM05_3446 [Acidimicrobiales bacterium]|nr:hypothetical protein [Acidimicrobiales bacterium]
MSQRRTLILVAAIVIGALASFMVWQYVNGVKDSAYAGAQRVPVFLVKGGVAKGSYGEEARSAISQDEIPRKFLPPNAIHSLDDIRGKVAVNNLVPNQIVVSDMFVSPSDPTAQTSFANRLAKINGEDQVAITVQVDTVRGVADLLQPGDYVNVLLAPRGTAGGADTSATGTKPVDPKAKFDGMARYLYQKVQVLAIDKTPIPLPGEATAASAATSSASASTPAKPSTGLVTLIVPAKAAQFIASALPDQIYLTLVARDYQAQPLAPLSTAEKDVLPGEDPALVTPYGPKK